MVPSEYGKLDVINTTVSLMVPIFSFQIVEAILRFAVESHVEKRNRNLLSNAMIFSILAFVFSLVLYPAMRNISVFAQYSVYLYTIFFLTIVNGIVKQYIRGLELIKLYVVSDIFFSIVFAMSNMVLLIILKLGIKAYLLSNIISLLCTIVLILLVAGLYKQLNFRFDKQLLKEMLAYSVPLIPNGIMWWIVSVSDRYIISCFLGYEATGIYSVAARFPSLLTVLYGIFFQAWQLSAMEEYGKENYSEFFGKVFGVISSVLFLGSSVLFLIIKPFMNVYVGQAYSESWKYVPFLFLGATFNTFASFYGVNYTASKRTIGAFSTSVIAAGVKITVMLALIKFWGIQAASFSALIAYFSMWIARILHTRKLVDVEIDKKHIVASTVIVLIQITMLLTVNSLALYTGQVVMVVAQLMVQKKYLKQILIFGKMLMRTGKI
jgi:O-antigen/teichoic acid export membrane protein